MRFDKSLGLVVSTTDLLKFLNCEALSLLDLYRAEGLITPTIGDGSLSLAAAKGLEGEAEALDSLSSLYGEPVRIDGRDEPAFRATLRAMESGAPLIYQGLLLSRSGAVLYESRPDFLVRVDHPSRLGGFSYEPLDSKLARAVKLDGLIQVVDYADALEQVQGVLPRKVHLYLAGSDLVSLATDAYVEEVRLHKRRYLAHLGQARGSADPGQLPAVVDPRPNSYCEVCQWRLNCESFWEESDSLFRVAGITGNQVSRLGEAGITTLSALAGIDARNVGIRIAPDVLANLAAQAGAQLRSRQAGGAKPYFEFRHDAHLRVLEGRGLGLLPRPSAGDIFFDIEGDPFYRPDGLEYLFGVAYLEGGCGKFRAFWGTDPSKEKEAFGSLVDFIIGRWRRHPGMHVYHYADYERNALAKLASRCNFKIHEVDEILRNGLLVDLLPIVRSSLVIGAESYSLKKIEKLYLSAARGEAVTTAMGSVEAFEEWLAGGDDSILSEIERYNEADVRSTAELRDFLLDQRDRLCREQGYFPYPNEGVSPTPDGGDKSARVLELERTEELLGARAEKSCSAAERAAIELCSDLVGFHSREEKPAWWRYFYLISPERTVQDYYDDSESFGDLSLLSSRSDTKGNPVFVFSFDPLQPIKLKKGDSLLDPQLLMETHQGFRDGAKFGSVASIDLSSGTLEARVHHSYPAALVPKNLIHFELIGTSTITDAITRFSQMLAGSTDAASLNDCGVEILFRARPKFISGERRFDGLDPFREALSPGLREDDPGGLAAMAAAALDRSYLVIQGPPGSGKTYQSARIISELVLSGQKVFVTANSHSAIDNLLAEIVSQTGQPSLLWRVSSNGARRADGVNSLKPGDIGGLAHAEGGLVCGGTVWNAVREELHKTFDYGFIDEAGQYSLANAIAFSSACRNLVLSGDPQQLPQPVIGSHPAAASKSVLGHLVGERDVVESDRGIFLPRTYRMHPAITEVVSAVSYDSRLLAMDDLARMELCDPGPFPKHGLAFVPVAHRDNVFRSLEEVHAAKRIVNFLLEREWIDKRGQRNRITPDQVMVIAPYNAQTNALEVELAGIASVGTVDKFQGREAAFVLVSLSASDGESSSRGVDFLFSLNRLNVAISRAKVMTVIIASPSLIESKPASVEQLGLLGAIAKVTASAVRVDVGGL